jgi:orotidine-5'-phosphate decarboxylase
MTPAEAIAAGADHVVVGRPIYRAGDPKTAAEAIVAEMQGQTPNRIH